MTRTYTGGIRITLAVLLFAPSVLAGERVETALRDGWFVKQVDASQLDVNALAQALRDPDGTWLATSLPAQVHDVLFAHGKIPDPRVGKNAAECAWVGEKDWVYGCVFETPPARGGPTFLRLDGIDTLATAYLNGREVGRFDNMYRRYRVDVTDALAPRGERNTLFLVFASPVRFLRDATLPEGARGLPRHKLLRKCHSDFGSYLGARPNSVKVGVFRDVVLDRAGLSWLEDVWVRPEVVAAYDRASVHVLAEVGGEDAVLSWTLLDPGGRTVDRGTARAANGTAQFELTVSNPALWWPRTHGEANLYRLECSLSRGGDGVDWKSVTFGIREVKPVLRDPATGETRFRFDINGQPVFLRGACWAPLEGMTHCWSSGRADRLLDLMEHGRMNVLRIWGEGHIPPPEFYAECDRRGILIWQDFMFGYGMHPSGEPAFDENCRLEVEDMIRRLRNHPSIFLWCGGNENHMGWDFAHGKAKPLIGTGLFQKTMPEACAELDPGRLFHPSSPHGGRVPNWPLEGDWHDYSTLKFCPEASVPLYASEVGRASAPSLSSMRRFLSEEDLWPFGWDPRISTPGKAAWPPMWQYRSVGGSWDKVGPVEQYCDPRDAADLIRVLGTAHGDYLRDRVERQRRGVPDGEDSLTRRCWGNMVWRLNDSWPILYWSVIDYYLEPKIPFYYLRRAYEPVLVSFEETRDRISVWIVNDSPETARGTLVVRRVAFSGAVKGELSIDVALAAGESRRCLDTSELGPIVKRREFLEARFGQSSSTHLLIGERFLRLPRVKLEARRVAGGVELKTDRFAYQVTLESDGVTGAVFEDNFFHLTPGATRTVRVVDAAGAERLRVRALNADDVELGLGGTKLE